MTRLPVLLLSLLLAGCAGFNSPTAVTKCAYCGWLVTPIGSEDGVVYYQCLSWTCGMVTAATNSHVPNLKQVVPGVWRGGQPDADGFRWLKEHGVTNVVKLNPNSEGSDKAAVRLGMSVHYCPITVTEQLVGPDKKKLKQAVSFIQPGTLVHCTHGQDRTGLVIAIWREQRGGWTRAQAEKEMLDLGFHKALRGLWETWEDKKYD